MYFNYISLYRTNHVSKLLTDYVWCLVNCEWNKKKTRSNTAVDVKYKKNSNLFLFTLDKFNKLCTTSKFKAIVDALLDDKPNIELDNAMDQSAALIAQNWDNKTYKSVEYCDFKVIAKTSRYESPRGIFASIRRMNLRKSSSNECIDYVVFEVGSGMQQKSQKMCGIIEGDQVYDASNFFEAPGGTMKVVIFINRYTTLETGRDLGIELSFTAYDGKFAEENS